METITKPDDVEYQARKQEPIGSEWRAEIRVFRVSEPDKDMSGYVSMPIGTTAAAVRYLTESLARAARTSILSAEGVGNAIRRGHKMTFEEITAYRDDNLSK